MEAYCYPISPQSFLIFVHLVKNFAILISFCSINACMFCNGVVSKSAYFVHSAFAKCTLCMQPCSYDVSGSCSESSSWIDIPDTIDLPSKK